MEDVKSIDEVIKIAECLTRREIYKTKVSFVCQKCGVKTETSLRQFKERGKKNLICQKCETKNKFMQKYGVDNVFKAQEFIEKNKENNLSTKKITDICEKNNIELLEEYKGVHENGKWKYYSVRCKECKNVFKTYFYDRARNCCPICFPKTSSQGEEEIKEFISQNYSGKIIFNDRTILDGKELDVYIPDLKIAIEYDGAYWHSDVNNYFKYKECRKQGIRLIHIIENTWLQKKEIVKSVLSSVLNICPKKYYARKCEIKEIDNKTYKDFCEENHLQGYAVASVRLGLFYQDELIQIMSFSKSRFDKTIEWEMIRECSKINCGIVGGKKKLLKYFEKNYKPKSLISYCWKDYFEGKSYTDSGFKLSKETKPNYFYTKNSLSPLESREKFQKHKLKKVLKTFDENLTEQENMKNNNYLKIFDYGNYVFKKNY